MLLETYFVMKNMTEPFLFRFRQPCSTLFNGETNAKFDTNTNMVMIEEKGIMTPIIFSNSQNIPTTKKADIEKGDDQKDSLMWK